MVNDVRHISPWMEERIRETIKFVSERAREARDLRMTMLDKDGVPPPVEVNEREAMAWRNALVWVLKEADL